MNDCSQTKTLLMLAADGELDTEQTAALERHVDLCAACRLERDRFLELDRQMGSYGDLLEQAALAARRRRKVREMVRWVPAIAVALAAVLVLGVMLIHTRSPVRPNEVLDEAFVPIPYVQPLDPYETGTVMRMDVSVAALIAVGYKVDMTDPTAVVSADVLVGEDGRAHAVHVLSGVTLN